MFIPIRLPFQKTNLITFTITVNPVQPWIYQRILPQTKDYPGLKNRMSFFIMGPKNTKIIISKLCQKEKAGDKNGFSGQHSGLFFKALAKTEWQEQSKNNLCVCVNVVCVYWVWQTIIHLFIFISFMGHNTLRNVSISFYLSF